MTEQDKDDALEAVLAAAMSGLWTTSTSQTFYG
jgi:hypothetical protein